MLITSNSEMTFLDAGYILNALQRDRDILIHEIFSCHPPGVNTGFVKEQALRLLRTNSNLSTFNKNVQSFKIRLKNREYL